MIHSAWHIPTTGQYDTTLGWYLFNLIPLTFILNWFYLKSRFNVIPIMLLHASTNVIGNTLPTPTDVLDGTGTFVLLRAVVYWAIAISLIIATKGRLGLPSRKAMKRGPKVSDSQPKTTAARPNRALSTPLATREEIENKMYVR